MRLLHRVLVPAVVVVGALSAASPALASIDRHAPNHRISHGTSTNWSGYAVTGSGPYTSVSSSWTQPAVDCAVTPTGFSAFWVGLDGDTTNSVEQTGTEAECSGGTPVYFAWYEMYPKAPVNYPNPVAAGDNLSASVVSVGRGHFRLTLTDTTKGWTQTVMLRHRSAKLGSAEAIAEAPSSGRRVLPLADFGTVGFADVSVNGSLLTSSTPGLEPLTMENGRTVEAVPSSISGGGFSDTWQHE